MGLRKMAARAGSSNRTPATNMQEIRKALFSSPGAVEDEQSNVTKSLMSKLQIEHDVEASLKGLQKELHEQRMKDLRQLQKNMADDDWRYTPIEKLIGLH